MLGPTRCSARSPRAHGVSAVGAGEGQHLSEPALLAKMVTTLDVISSGRAMLGIGAGWFEPEHEATASSSRRSATHLAPRGCAPDHPPDAARRAPDLRRALLPHQGGDQLAASAPVERRADPIGGNGEKRTLRLVARYANESTSPARPPRSRRSLEALERHCAELDRDRREIQSHWLGSVGWRASATRPSAYAPSSSRPAASRWTSCPSACSSDRECAVVAPGRLGEFVQRELRSRGRRRRDRQPPLKRATTRRR